MPLSILVVDDDESMRAMIVQLMLVWFEATVFSAKNGKEAIEIMAEKKLNLIVTDYQMPEMTGPELIRFIKKEDIPTKIVLVTGAADEIKEKHSDILGRISGMVEKPFSIVDLKKVIGDALGL